MTINITKKKLSAMPYAQAHVELYDDGTIVLISYSTAVVQLVPDTEKGGYWIGVSGLYSATTRKHISAFMREYTTCDYYRAKELCQKHLLYNPLLDLTKAY